MGVSRQGSGVSTAARIVVLSGACALLAGCGASDKFARKVDPRYGVEASPRVVALGSPVPKGGGTYRVGRPYQIAGRTFVPAEDENFVSEGIASWYGSDFHGRRTANGEVYDMEGLSAAHPTLPMPSYVRVTNLRNKRSVIVRVNDRGPFHGNRVVDVSKKAADLLGFHGHGVARVRVEYVGRAALEGSDDQRLVATYREGEPAPSPSAVRLASARSFLPQRNSVSPALHSNVPVPAGRPYTLGQESGPTVTYSGTSQASYPASRSTLIATSDTLDGQAASLRSGGSIGFQPALAPASRGVGFTSHNLY